MEMCWSWIGARLNWIEMINGTTCWIISNDKICKQRPSSAALKLLASWNFDWMNGWWLLPIDFKTDWCHVWKEWGDHAELQTSVTSFGKMSKEKPLKK